MPPQFGRLDASCGDLLINEGNRTFTWVGSQQSGLSLRGQVKDIVEIKSKTGSKIMVLQNNLTPVLYTFKSNKAALKTH